MMQEDTLRRVYTLQGMPGCHADCADEVKLSGVDEHASLL
jgi:hypothetical protein